MSTCPGAPRAVTELEEFRLEWAGLPGCPGRQEARPIQYEGCIPGRRMVQSWKLASTPSRTLSSSIEQQVHSLTATVAKGQRRRAVDHPCGEVA